MWQYAPALAQGVIGGLQSIFGAASRHRAEKDLESYANSYKTSPGILDYYNKALATYSANPYTSQYYQNQKNLIGRNQATAVNQAQSRGAALGLIGSLNQQANDASAKAGVNAEQLQGQQLGQLGQATNAKNQAEQKKFDMLYNLKAMKAGQSATTQNQGMQNLFGGLSNFSMLKYLQGGGDKAAAGIFSGGGTG